MRRRKRLKSLSADRFRPNSSCSGTAGALMSPNEGNSTVRKPTMTPITSTAEVSSGAAALEVAAAEKMLRDMAYALKLTRRVKAEMTAEHAPDKATGTRTGEGALVA